MTQKVKICMITDDNYAIPTAVAITSAILNKKDDSIYHFYILTKNISEFNKSRLAKLQTHNVELNFINVDASKYSYITVKTHVPQSAAIKFDIPNIINEDKVLYLDGDIIVRKDLSELYNTKLNKKIVAAVQDMGGVLKQKFHEYTYVEKYFNSGVMLLNLKEMRKGDYSQKLIDAKKDNPQWNCMDQDAFNYVLSKHTSWQSVKYNCMLPLYIAYGYTINEINDFYNTSYSDIIEMQADATIIHLAGEHKQRPWKVINGAFNDIWDTYYRLSPYKDISLFRDVFMNSPREVTSVRETIKKDITKIKKYKTTIRLFGLIPLLKIEEK